MECEKIINLLDNTPNQPSKFREESWVEINDDVHGIYKQLELVRIFNSASSCNQI